MSALDRFINEWADERIVELQRLIDTQSPYQPKPGDADYLTAKQIAQLHRENSEEDL